MEPFRFSTSEVTIEIEDCSYSVNFGDPKLQQEILEFTLELASAPMSNAQEDIYVRIHERIHYFVACLLGKKAEQEIFKDRPANVLDELRLFSYLQEAISDTASLKALEDMLGRFSVTATK